MSTLDAGARAAVEARKSMVYVCPPAGWTIGPLLSAVPDTPSDGPRIVAIAPEPGDVLDVARTLRPLPGFEPILPVTGIARAARLLAAGAARTLIVTARDAMRLAEMARLKLERAPVIALLWPEFILAADEGTILDTLLAESGDAQRIVVTSDPAQVTDLVERQARRAPVITVTRPPTPPMLPVRYVIVDGERRASAIRGILDLLNPAAALIWEPSVDRFERWAEFGEDPTVTLAGGPVPDRPVELAIAVELPSAEALARLAEATREIVVLIRASQLPYLQRIAHPANPLRLAGAADRAREAAYQLRQSVRERLEHADFSAELLALGPLFDEFEPAVVAAALARTPAAAAPPARAEPAPELPASIPAWVRIRLGVGTRDRVRPADVVGALLNGVGLPKDHVGKVDIKEGFCIVEVRAEDAQRTLRALSSVKIRGKSLGAKIGN